MEQVVDLLKNRDLNIPYVLFSNYKKLNITDTELIVLIYLLNTENLTYNPKEISNVLNVKMNEILEIINNLVEKGIISLDIVKVNKISSEVINLNLLYEKLAFIVIKKETEEKKSNTLYDAFEQELGRGLTPMEFEIINGWLNIEYTEELVICALKEAIYNGISNFRYIDRILFEWSKKGIKTKEDVEKNKREFKKSKNTNIDIIEDYDWLNDRGNN